MLRPVVQPATLPCITGGVAPHDRRIEQHPTGTLGHRRGLTRRHAFEHFQFHSVGATVAGEVLTALGA